MESDRMSQVWAWLGLIRRHNTNLDQYYVCMCDWRQGKVGPESSLDHSEITLIVAAI